MEFMWKSDPYNYTIRPTDEIAIGNLKLGGKNPIRIQSMANTDTNDIESSVNQCIRIINAGADLVRFTTQGTKEAESLRIIKNEIREKGYETPLVADIHFTANVADHVAQFIEKVRINPGNYVAGVKRASKDNYTDEEYQQEFEKIEARFTELLSICKEKKTAIRIGVNHGSLSERMLIRWGNTAEGMVESCMEFLRICRKENFENVVISMKASNTVQMIQSVRLLVEKMENEEFHFPIHLGVTEAGDGEDGRIKSAVGIGAILADGIGNTIRVSLSEEPEAEIPVATLLRDYIVNRANLTHKIGPKTTKPIHIKPFVRRATNEVNLVGNYNAPVVIAPKNNHPTFKADYIIEDNVIFDEKGNSFPIFDTQNYKTDEKNKAEFLRIHLEYLNAEQITFLKENPNLILLVETKSENPVGEFRAFVHTLLAEEVKNPVIAVGKYAENNLETLQIKAAADLGILFIEGLADGILLENKGTISSEDIVSISFGILQAARVRTSKTEYISCPGCGRTLFNLQTVIARIKEKTGHLTGLKIGIMGCIVNGPGEMADADYGYVGGSTGRVSLYKKYDCIEKGVPEEEAVDRLIELIKQHGDWVEPYN
jgi:(E)-4-hydroxy-3-methylbut-2-enyl-diphosphate synthase